MPADAAAAPDRGKLVYEGFFGLDRRPFSQAPDPEFLHWTAQHQQALDVLRAGVERSLSLIFVIGPDGVGKTTLVRRLVQEAPPALAVGYLPNAADDNVSIRAILAAFGRDAGDEPPEAIWGQLETLLVDRRGAGGRALLIVDRAERAPDPAFETLHRLAELKAGDVPLVTQALVGHPTLHARLSQPRFGAFVERPGVTFQFNPMSIKDTEAYIRRRLNAVGGDGAMFDDAALQAIHARAGGVPRKINSLCDLCLVAAHGAGVLGVDRALADAVIARTRYASGADAGARPMSHLSELREAGAARAGRGGVAAELAHLPFICLGPDDFIFADVAMAPLGSPGAALGLAGMPGRARRGSRKPPAARPAAGGGAVTAPLRRLSSDKRGSGRARSPSPGDLADGRPAAGAVQPPSARRQRTLRMLAVVAGGAVAAAALGVVLATGPGVDGLRLGFAPLSGLVATTPAADGATPELLPDGLGPAASVLPAGEGEGAQPGAAPVAVAALAPDDPGGADRLFRHGLDVSAEDPSAAAVDFARAAIRGHARAAYYLGQMYETGDGVPYDLALARAWYEKAGGLVWAQRRLAELPEAAGQGAAPLPLFAVRAETGETELVWSGSPADDPAGYVVELSASPEEGPVVARPVAASAVRLAPPPKAITWWRVAPAAPGAAAVASEWQRIAAVE